MEHYVALKHLWLEGELDHGYNMLKFGITSLVPMVTEVVV